MGVFQFFRRDESPPQEQQIEPEISDVLLRALLNGEAITREKALTLPAVSGDVDLISSCVACMPVKLYKVKQGKVEEVEDDVRVRMLNSDTGDTLDAYQMKKAMVDDYLLGKGGYCYIDRNRNDVQGLFYVEDRYIEIMKTYEPIFKTYRLLVMGAEYRDYDFIKILRNTKDGAQGTPVIDEVSKALETAYQTLLYQLGMVKSGGNKKGFLKSTHKLAQAEIDTLKAAWRRMYANNEENVVVLNNGIEFQEASNSSVEMQLNESKKTLQAEIDNIFHIYDDFDKTFKLGIYPIVKAFETALNRNLLLEKEKKNYFFEFDVKEIVKASLKERYESYKIAKETGFLTLNEIRREENRNYIEGLDVINVGLGAVLYDVDTHQYFTPNTGETVDLTEGAVDEDGMNEDDVLGNVDETTEENIEQNLDDEDFGGETLDGNEEEPDTEIDDILNDLEYDLTEERSQVNDRYASKYYDPAKAHEYYEKHKQLSEKKSTKKLNETGRETARFIKEQIKEERKAAIEAHKEEMKEKIEALREKYKAMSKDERKAMKEQIQAEIKGLRQEHKDAAKAIKDEYDQKYMDELAIIKADPSMQQAPKKKGKKSTKK